MLIPELHLVAECGDDELAQLTSDLSPRVATRRLALRRRPVVRQLGAQPLDLLPEVLDDVAVLRHVKGHIQHVPLHLDTVQETDSVMLSFRTGNLNIDLEVHR